MASWLRKILPLLIVHLCFGAVPQRWESIRTVELDGSESDEDIPHFEVLCMVKFDTEIKNIIKIESPYSFSMKRLTIFILPSIY